jgi:hypothetical protein
LVGRLLAFIMNEIAFFAAAGDRAGNAKKEMFFGNFFVELLGNFETYRILLKTVL